MGELSSARQALEGAAVAPGTEETREALQDPGKRPQEPYEPLPARLRNLEPDTQFQLDEDKFARNVRSAKRGAAPGPSGMTTDHLRPLLKSHQDTQLMCKLAGRFAQGQVPDNIVAAVRLGRMTALVKPAGGVRGIVVGDVFRRLVARTVAQQMGPAVEKATAPFQYALSTRAGCECIGHALQFLTERDPSATITSIDGISAFDTISRTAMMSGLAEVDPSVLPFVRLFYGSKSRYLWEDNEGNCHTIAQAEGGEQGDPLMPLLFALGQHRALVAVHSRLLPSESLMAYRLDDNHVVSGPDKGRARAHGVGGRTLPTLPHPGPCRENSGVERGWNPTGCM